MFKVPEWGNDIPDAKVNFGKTVQKKKEKKSTSLVPQESPARAVNGVSKKQTAKKSTDKRKLKKIRQKNREIYQNLSNPQNNQQGISENGSMPGKFVINPNKVEPLVNKYEKQSKVKPQKQKIKKQKPISHGTNNKNHIKKTIKRKYVSPKNPETDSIELENIDTNKSDKLILDAKKKKSDDTFKDKDREDMLFSEEPVEKPKGKIDFKKELIRKVLEGRNGNRNSVTVSGNSLRERMLTKLHAAQFRYLNEKLYTSSGTEAKELFQSDPTAFDTYHQGYQQQIKKWPVNPLDVIVKRIMKMPKTHAIADMGCGSASLAQRVPHKVRSFDLVAAAPGVEACDMAHTPLLSSSVDAAVYCLALMGTELAAYLVEGNRVLKTGGHLLIAEVESRFDKLEDFTHSVERLGFKLLKADQSHKVFFFLEFRKTQEAPRKAKHVVLTLKPCLYKRR